MYKRQVQDLISKTKDEGQQDLSKTKDEGLSSFVTLFSRGSFVKAIAENEEWNENAQSKMSILGVKELTKQCKSKKDAELRKWLATSGL